MATIHEQYAELAKQGQEAALAALKAWTRVFQQTVSRLSSSGLTSPEQLIDDIHDFAGHLLDTQRDVAKQFVAAGTAAAGQVRDRVTQTGKSATQN